MDKFLKMPIFTDLLKSACLPTEVPLHSYIIYPSIIPPSFIFTPLTPPPPPPLHFYIFTPPLPPFIFKSLPPPPLHFYTSALHKSQKKAWGTHLHGAGLLEHWCFWCGQTQWSRWKPCHLKQWTPVFWVQINSQETLPPETVNTCFWGADWFTGNFVAWNSEHLCLGCRLIHRKLCQVVGCKLIHRKLCHVLGAD